MKIYLAGPMQGLPDFNFPAFFAAAEKLRSEGHTVFNPAEADLETWPTMEAINEFYKTNKEEMKRIVMRKDVNWIIDEAEAIAILPNWLNSRGVHVELALAKYLGLQEIYL